MYFENGEVKTNFFKRAKSDSSISGLKGLYKKNPEAAQVKGDEIIRNTYRTLMTRGLKGCRVFCTDKKLAEYLKSRRKDKSIIQNYYEEEQELSYAANSEEKQEIEYKIVDNDKKEQYIDLSIMPKSMIKSTVENLSEKYTYIDLLNRDFPLEYTERNAIVFDVSHVNNRDITTSDINISIIEKGMFIGFYTSCDDSSIGTEKNIYRKQLSLELIEELVKREISAIGIDNNKIRYDESQDTYTEFLGSRNIFTIYNLYNLKELSLDNQYFKVNITPMSFMGLDKTPCKVIAKTYE